MNNFLNFFLLQIIFTSVLFSSSQELEKISLQLKWKHQFQFAGFYMAKEKGFYSDVGLDVNFLEFENNTDIVNDLITQKVNYALVYPGLSGNREDRKDVVILSALLQHSPHVLVSLKSSNINSIEDFKNRTIMIGSSATNSVSFLSMLKSHGVTLDDMNVLKPSFNIKSLLSGETELMTAFTTNELYELDKQNIEYRVWNPTKYGFGFYDDMLVTSRQELQDFPQRVENFKKASLKGFEYAYSHIDETVDLILKKYNTQNKSKEALLYEAHALKKLAYKGTKTVGKVSKHRVQRVMDIYNLFGFIKEPASADNRIYHSPTEELLTRKEKEYLESKNITMCIDPVWMPFESFKDNKYVGMSADFFKLVEKKIEKKIDVIHTKTWGESLQLSRKRECDLLSLVMSTPEREKYLKFTEPYLKIPLVMATQLDAPFTTDLNSLVGKKIGISKGYAFVELLRTKYPKLDITEVEHLHDGLNKVQDGKLYGYIGTLAAIGYAFQTEYTGDLKITAKFDGSWDLGIGVRNDDKVLFEILNKVIKSIDENEKQQILNNWLSIKYEKGTDYTLLFQVLGVFVIISLIALFFFVKQNKLTRKIQEQKDKLQLTVLALKNKEKELETLASIDPLSKLYNRRYFSHAASDILSLAKRESYYLSVVMIDIDDFKRINDTYGHKIGDDVIVVLANMLLNTSRSSDIVCRFGGEEFILLLPKTDIKGAAIIAEKIKESVEALSLSVEESSELKFTLSIGVSEVMLDEVSIEDSIKRADTALYEAKNSGKNRVCIA